MVDYHKPVLLKELLGFLSVSDENDNWYVDATLGDGGHSLEIIKLGGKVIGIDADPNAIERVGKRFDEVGVDRSQYRLYRSNFRDLKQILSRSIETSRDKQSDSTDPDKIGADGKKLQAVLFDLGVSSQELDDPSRGFSVSKNGPLDMRMDPSLEVSALDLINGLNKGELYELFTKLGDERLARFISEAVVSSREITWTTKDLADLVAGVYRKKGVKPGKIHPATKVFQALRIAVNDELNALKEALPQSLELIEKNGLVLVISFHSLEDRIVKSTFREWQSSGFGETLTKKPLIPGEGEVRDNPRSRSAKLRVFKKGNL